MSSSPILETVITLESGDITDDGPDSNQPASDATAIKDTWKINSTEVAPLPRGNRVRHNRKMSSATSGGQASRRQDAFKREFNRHVLGKRTMPEEAATDKSTKSSDINKRPNISHEFSTSHHGYSDKSPIAEFSSAATQVQEAARQHKLIQNAGLATKRKCLETETGPVEITYPVLQVKPSPPKKAKVSQAEVSHPTNQCDQLHQSPGAELKNPSQKNTIFRNEVALIQLHGNNEGGKQVELKINNNTFKGFSQEPGTVLAEFNLPEPSPAANLGADDLLQKAMIESEIDWCIRNFDESLFDDVPIEDEELNCSEVCFGPVAEQKDHAPEQEENRNELGKGDNSEDASNTASSPESSPVVTETQQNMEALSLRPSGTEAVNATLVQKHADGSIEQASGGSQQERRRLRQKLNSQRNRAKAKEERNSLEDFHSTYLPFLKAKKLTTWYCNVLVGPEVWIKTYKVTQTPSKQRVWQQDPNAAKNKDEKRRIQQAVNSHRNREKHKERAEMLREFKKVWLPELKKHGLLRPEDDPE